MDLGKGYYSDNTPEIVELSKLSEAADQIENDLFIKYDVKRGLRDLNGKGVLTGLTRISEIIAKEVVDGKEIPKDGEIYFRGYDVHNLIDAAVKENRFAFEECTYLLLFDKLPSGKELFEFEKLLGIYKSLPTSFVRDVIMKAPSRDMMNTLARSVLTLYSYDDLADDVSLPNVLRQSLQLISMFPLLSIYGYHAYNHY
ncbi:MAG: citrate synthase, partial [Butyrivibrio sp.]|nr:citrate synthase [Butyrivibrio sp.]